MNEGIIILLQCLSLFTNSSNFSKHHMYFHCQSSAEVIKILQRYVLSISCL